MNKLKALWNKLPEGVQRVAHTFWEVAGGVLLAQLFAARSAKDVYAAFVVAGAAGFAAAKALVVARG